MKYSVFDRLYVTLYWLRHGEIFKTISRIFGISVGEISQIIRQIIPILVGKLKKFNPTLVRTNNFLANIQVIKYFAIGQFRSYQNFFQWVIAGAIDGTHFVRKRVHPGQVSIVKYKIFYFNPRNQAKYYRGDKHCHFLLGQVIVHASGLFRDLKLFFGHNNDQG